MTLEAMYEAAAKAATKWWADNQGYGNPEEIDAIVAKAAVDAALAEAKKVNLYTDGRAWYVSPGVDEPGTYAIVRIDE